MRHYEVKKQTLNPTSKSKIKLAAVVWRQRVTMLRCHPMSVLELHQRAETGDREELMHEHLLLLSQTTADWQTLRHGRDSELSSNNKLNVMLQIPKLS